MYAQINVGAIADNDGLMIGGAFRLTRVRYDDFSSDPAGLFNEVDGTYLEPALVFRAPLHQALSLEGEIGTSIPLKQTNWELFETRRRFGSIGVRYRLGW